MQRFVPGVAGRRPTVANYTGRFVWVGLREFPYEGSSLLGVYTSLAKGKKALGDGKEWVKAYEGRYEQLDSDWEDTVLIRVKTDEF